MEGWGEGWESVVEDEEVAEAPEVCREWRWLAPDGVECVALLCCRVIDRFRAMDGLCGVWVRSRASAPWILALELISCSFLSKQTKDDSRRRRDRRSRISEEVAGELPKVPPNSRYRPRRAAVRLIRREEALTQEYNVFSRAGLAVQEPITDSLTRAFLDSKRGVDSDYGDSCTAAVRTFVMRECSDHQTIHFRNPSPVTLSMGWPAGLA